MCFLLVLFVPFECVAIFSRLMSLPGGRSSTSVPSSPIQLIPNEKLKKMVDLLVHPNSESHREEFSRMQNMLEETLTKNKHLQKNLQLLSEEVARLQK